MMNFLKMFLTVVIAWVFACLPIYSADIHVPDDQPTIQAAITAAINGDTVILADGTYYGIGNIDLDTQGKAITITSENGPEECLIYCLHDGRGFHIQNGEEETTIISNLTISSGSADKGGGIYCENGTPTVTGCVFLNNEADAGAGMFYEANQTVSITNCTFHSNKAVSSGGALSFEYNSTVDLQDNIFIANAAQNGGAVYLPIDGTMTITNCSFSGNSSIGENSGGGAVFCDFSTCLIQECQFDHNFAGNGGALTSANSQTTLYQSDFFENYSAEYGGVLSAFGNSIEMYACTMTQNYAFWGAGAVICQDMDVTVTDSVFSQNVSLYDGGGGLYLFGCTSGSIANSLFMENQTEATGGGLFSQNTEMEVSNCTFVGNISDEIPHALHAVGSTQHIINSIFWDDSPEDLIFVELGSVVEYCDVGQSSGTYPGEGNINSDPLFVTGLLGDYYLSQTSAGQASNSPCVNSGKSASTDTCYNTYDAAMVCMDERCTDTQGMGDSDAVDMGYHYMCQIPPTPTPTPMPVGVDLVLNDDTFEAGELFMLQVYIYCPGQIDVDLYVALIYGEAIWFWPTWGMGLCCQNVDLDPSGMADLTILEFNWPEGDFGTVDGFWLTAAAFESDTFRMIGQSDAVTFGCQ